MKCMESGIWNFVQSACVCDNILTLLSQHAVSSQDNILKFAFGAQGSKP